MSWAPSSLVRLTVPAAGVERAALLKRGVADGAELPRAVGSSLTVVDVGRLAGTVRHCLFVVRSRNETVLLILLLSVALLVLTDALQGRRTVAVCGASVAPLAGASSSAVSSFSSTSYSLSMFLILVMTIGPAA